MKSTHQQSGQRAEYRAEQYLKRQGLKIITRNYTARTGEIDLIMAFDQTLVFVEVRLRNSHRFGTGADSVDIHKQKKIIRTAEYYIQHQTSRKRPWREYRFDVVSIDEAIHWIPNAFTLD